MKIISIANHKGGVGKSATAQALGVVLAAQGQRVLLCDLDPQASLTQACGVTDSAGQSLAEVLGGATPGRLGLADVLRELAPGLSLAPADIALSTTELGLTTRLGRESVMRRALQPVAGRFDVAICDCPPSLGLLTVGALAASAGVLIPTLPQIVDMRGLALFLTTLDTIRAELNPDLQTLGVLVTFYDSRLTHHRAAVEMMRDSGLPLLPVMVGRSVKVAEAAGVGQSIVTYDQGNPQAENYRQVAAEVLKWLNNNPT